MTIESLEPTVLEMPVQGLRLRSDRLGECLKIDHRPTLLAFLRHFG